MQTELWCSYCGVTLTLSGEVNPEQYVCPVCQSTLDSYIYKERDDLKDCPFCGNGVEIKTTIGMYSSEYYSIACPNTNCWAYGGDRIEYFDKASLIEEWNRRS